MNQTRAGEGFDDRAPEPDVSATVAMPLTDGSDGENVNRRPDENRTGVAANAVRVENEP